MALVETCMSQKNGRKLGKNNHSFTTVFKKS